VRDGSALAEAWPAFINIPSKIGQVAAVRALARRRRESDLEREILLASVCPERLRALLQRCIEAVEAGPPDGGADDRR
jgi:hypothetical protein